MWYILLLVMIVFWLHNSNAIFRSTNYFTSSVQSRKRIRNGDTCQISSLEHVEVLVSFSYTRRRGNVVLTLESPAGTKSFLLTPRPIDSIKFYGSGSWVWYYSSVHFWGEKIDGLWTLTAKSDSPFTTEGKQWTGHYILCVFIFFFIFKVFDLRRIRFYWFQYIHKYIWLELCNKKYMLLWTWREHNL